jgi:hypothetical protein
MAKQILSYDIDKEISEEFNNYLYKIADQIQEIMIRAIILSVYRRYNPVEYKRTYALAQCVSVKVDTTRNVLLAYIDEDKLDYFSAVDGRAVTPLIPYIIEEGHNDDYPYVFNMYHHYPARRYLEMARDMILTQLGIDVEIVKNPPQYV